MNLDNSFRCDPLSYLTYDVSPNPGPELASVYVPGTPGASWTEDEIKSTRLRILQVQKVTMRMRILKYLCPQAIHPDWNVQKDLYNMKGNGRTGITENRILRLVFHDCVKYTGKVLGQLIRENNSNKWTSQMALEVVMAV